MSEAKRKALQMGITLLEAEAQRLRMSIGRASSADACVAAAQTLREIRDDQLTGFRQVLRDAWRVGRWLIPLGATAPWLVYYIAEHV